MLNLVAHPQSPDRLFKYSDTKPLLSVFCSRDDVQFEDRRDEGLGTFGTVNGYTLSRIRIRSSSSGIHSSALLP
jgi:hypothetical protein